MGMSYRKAWLLVDGLNRVLREPVVTAEPGGSGGGGAMLTPAGEEVISIYHAIEAQARVAVGRECTPRRKPRP
jgi:molybdate transport system regulatory protein